MTMGFYVCDNGNVFTTSNWRPKADRNGTLFLDWDGKFPPLKLSFKKIRGEMWTNFVGQPLLSTLKSSIFEHRQAVFATRSNLTRARRFIDPLIFERDTFSYMERCEWHMVKHLHICDAVIMIQSVYRGREGRAKWLEEYAWDSHDKWHASLAMKIQTSWRRYSKRYTLSLMRALREFELRGPRLRYQLVIDAVEVIQRYWAHTKLKRRLKLLTRQQQIKAYADKHGIYDAFYKAVNTAFDMRLGDSNSTIPPIRFVGLFMSSLP